MAVYQYQKFDCTGVHEEEDGGTCGHSLRFYPDLGAFIFYDALLELAEPLRTFTDFGPNDEWSWHPGSHNKAVEWLLSKGFYITKNVEAAEKICVLLRKSWREARLEVK